LDSAYSLRQRTTKMNESRRQFVLQNKQEVDAV
jgi:hypothetical protein